MTPIASAVHPCKICGAGAALMGVVDFHKSCVDATGLRLPVSGMPVYYRRCEQCGFIFTEAFDAWSIHDFAERIYNDGYAAVDPDYDSVRPRNMARFVAGALAASRERITILDYGGGHGLLARTLREEGFRAESWDPFVEGGAPPCRRYEVITLFEVMEHLPDPAQTVAEIARLLAPGGLVLFSTLLQPEDMAAQGLNWWYVGPRNGHISLFSAEALRRLFAMQGMTVQSYNAGMHSAGIGPVA